MRDYGRVYSSFWTSDSTRGLSDRGKVLAIYLLTGPHCTMLGCFRIPTAYIAHDLGWSSETVSEGFAELFRNGFGTHDEGSGWVFIHAFLRWNRFENPNQAKAAVKLFQQVPDGFAAKPELAKRLAEQIARFSGVKMEPFPNSSGTVSEPFRNQDQEQDQEQEKKDTSDATSSTSSESVSRPSKKPKPKTADESDERFAKFWAAYPRKAAKPAAAKAFAKVNPSPDLLAKMLHAIASQARSDAWQKNAGEYIPHPATWINQRRWEDEGTAPVSPPAVDHVDAAKRSREIIDHVNQPAPPMFAEPAGGSR